MTDGFQRALDHIRSIADSESAKERLFVLHNKLQNRFKIKALSSFLIRTLHSHFISHARNYRCEA